MKTSAGLYANAACAWAEQCHIVPAPLVGPHKGGGNRAARTFATRAMSLWADFERLDFARKNPLLFLFPLGLVPQRVHLGERRPAGRLAARLERALDRGKAALEFLIGRAQHGVRIRIKMTRQIDDRKQQVARLGASFPAVA